MTGARPVRTPFYAVRMTSRPPVVRQNVNIFNASPRVGPPVPTFFPHVLKWRHP